MAEIALTEAKIAQVYTDPGLAEVHTVICAETITPGEALYILANGTVGIADGSVDSMDEAQYVALQGGVANQRIPGLRRGHVYGFTVAAVDCGKVIHLSNTPGDFQVDAGDEPVGRVVSLPGGATTDRVIYFEFSMGADIG